jgi:hypothetical protein
MKRTALGLAALLLGACVGHLEPLEDDTGGGDDAPASAARQMFDDDVAPLLASCAGCHSGAAGSQPLKFLGSGGASGYYAAITAQASVIGNWDPAGASLLTKGAHQGVPAWSTAQSDTISMWLIAEADERP